MRLWNMLEAAPTGGGDSAAKGPAAAAGSAAAAPSKEAASVPGLLKTFPTKATPVFALYFTQRNLLMGTGALTLPPTRHKPGS